VDYILSNAERIVRGRVVRIGRATYRVSICLLKGQYYVVYKPREPLAPRVWLITLPGFKLCDIPVGKPLKPCNRRVRSVWVTDRELVDVCDYHGAFFSVLAKTRTRAVVLHRQLKPVPPALCVRFCPQCIYMGEEQKGIVTYEVYECRAFMPYINEKEERHRRRPYRGMHYLCIEDYWWRRYLRRHEK